METVMQIFAIFGIIISLVALILFISWAVSFYTSVAFKTFKHSLNKYVEVKNEDIEKKACARRERLEKAREQKKQHKQEMQEVKLQSKQDLFEIKKRALITKEKEKVEKAKADAQLKTGLNFEDIGGNLTEEFFENKKEEMLENAENSKELETIKNDKPQTNETKNNENKLNNTKEDKTKESNFEENTANNVKENNIEENKKEITENIKIKSEEKTNTDSANSKN